ncbi:MAG: DUF3164 family protein [Bacteroidales bacterium]|nr:DUF3164 family protein [Bacteroidales bacterium]
MGKEKLTSVEMTTDQLAEFRAFQEAKAAEQAKAQAKQMREDYREMVDDAIKTSMPGLRAVSEKLADYKRKVFEDFSAILDMKGEMFKMEKGDELDNQSHTFTNSQGTMRIVLGHYVTDNYLDTVKEGIAMVQQYISSLASDDKSQALVEMVMRLLAKDAKGSLKASRVIQLRKAAERSGAPEFIEGVKIIEEAYQPIKSRTFLKAYEKNADTGAWVQIPLGMTEA